MNADRSATSRIQQVTIWGMILNVVLTIVKLAAGYLGNSRAVMADGVHSLSDMSTDVAVLVGLQYWSKPPDKEHPYGHRRIETIITVLIGVALALVGLGLAYSAYVGMGARSGPPPCGYALAAAVLSIFVKEFLYRWTLSVSRDIKSSALAANAWHHRTDALSSIPVAVAVGAAAIDPAWAMLDNVATVAVGVLILQAAWSIVHPALNELMDRGAGEEHLEQIRAIVAADGSVRSMHAIRTRFHGSGIQVDLHLLVDPDISVKDGHDIATRVKRELLASGPDIIDVLIHVEPFNEDEMNPQDELFSVRQGVESSPPAG